MKSKLPQNLTKKSSPPKGLKKAKPLLYIDGSSGSTGLTIKNLIKSDKDLEILKIPKNKRKDLATKLKIFNKADLVVLCLPDNEAINAAKLISRDTKVIDVSSAHRINKNWCYGMSEISKRQKEAIKNSYRVANPGCYPTGFLLLIKPLIVNKLLNPKQFISYQAISGYSGGGKKLVEFYEKQIAKKQVKSYSARYYGVLQDHKHIKEMLYYSGLRQTPHFLPLIANFKRGMVSHIPLSLEMLQKKVKLDDLVEIYQTYYKGKKLVVPHLKAYIREHSPTDLAAITPDLMAESNKVELMVAGNYKNFSLLARYDNLGKGSSGAALQNINLMLGRSEYKSLF